MRTVAPPWLSPEEVAREEQVRRQVQQKELAREEAARRDRWLMSRYPDEASHIQARQQALAPVLRQIDEAQARLDELEARAAFEGLRQGQRGVLQDRLAERDRIVARHDAELARLRRLWTGAAPGSLQAPAAPTAPP